MLTAHLPSGYCLAKLARIESWAFFAALIGSVLPDFDLILFYFVDGGSIHHHRYWVHIPLFWAITAGFVLPFAWKTKLRFPILIFYLAILVHLILDSLAGGIMWLAPFNTDLWALVEVPASQPHWILSFVFHWTFALELVIWAIAIYLFIKSRKAYKN